MASMHREDYEAAVKTGFTWTNTHGIIAVAAFITAVILFLAARRAVGA